MRYKRQLTKDQILFLLANGHLSNKMLADKFNVKPSIISVYKYRARQAGFNIPKMQGQTDSIIEDMKKWRCQIKVSSLF